MPNKSQADSSALAQLLSTAQAAEFRQRLRKAIERSPYTHKEVAELLDVREATVSDWLTSEGLEYLPAGQNLLRLGVILDSDFHWLMTGEGSAERKPDAEWRVEMIRRVLAAKSPSAESAAELERLLRLLEIEAPRTPASDTREQRG